MSSKANKVELREKEVLKHVASTQKERPHDSPKAVRVAVDCDWLLVPLV